MDVWLGSGGNCAPGTLILITFYIIIIAHTSIAINLQMIVLALYVYINGSTGVCAARGPQQRLPCSSRPAHSAHLHTLPIDNNFERDRVKLYTRARHNYHHLYDGGKMIWRSALFWFEIKTENIPK